MKIKDIALSAAYVGQRVVKAICVGAQEVWSAIKYILFADPVVEQICVANFSSDGIGLLPEDAAKVTSIGTVFKGNTEITSFDELNQFERVTSLTDAFNGCTSLTTVNLDNIVNLGDNTFNGCTSFGGAIKMPNLLTIGKQNIFANTSITSIDDFGKITVLNSNRWNRLFAGCTSLVRVILPPTLKVIDENTAANGGVFNGCSALQSINLENIEHIGSSSFLGCSGLNMALDATNLKSIGNQAFSNAALRYVNLPNVVAIGEKSFFGCVIEDYVSMPSLEGSLPKQTFRESSVARILNLGKITTIGGGAVYDGAFREAKQLQLIHVPSTISSIGDYAFNVCSSLKSIILNNPTPITINSNTFTGIPSSAIFYVPDASVDAYKTTSGWMDYASNIQPLSQYVES